MTTRLRACLVTILAALAVLPAASAQDVTIISEPTEITSPTRLGPTIVVDGGELVVRDVPEPGLEMDGNLWAVGSGVVRISDSVVQFLSTYHGQYSLAGVDRARVEVSGCDYRVPAGVQHGLVVAGEAEMVVVDTRFDDVQLLAAETATLRAERLDGNFEVIVQHDAGMELADIPRRPGAGSLWVWVEFPSGSEAVYSPPMPGYVSEWSFPPPGATGIAQRVEMQRCEARLWPMLVREGSRLTLRDVAEENWVVVGLHMPRSATVRGLVNDLAAGSWSLDLDDRELHLDNASVDTWNLYPQARARVVVRDSVVGEILSMGDSAVVVEDSVVDGTGGFLGARDRSVMALYRSVVTSTVEASQDSTLRLHHSAALPYPVDTTGEWTRLGAYDRGRILLDATAVESTPVVGGDGLIGVTWIADVPDAPPAAPVTLHGTAALFSAAESMLPGSWRLEVRPRRSRHSRLLGEGDGNLEDGVLGTWEAADPRSDYELRLVLTDGLGRTLIGGETVRGRSFPTASSRAR